MNCKSITIYKDVDNNFVKAIIETDIGKMTIEKEEDLNKVLKSIAEQDKITVEELYKSDFVKVIKKEERKSEDKRDTLDDLTDEEYEIFFGTKNNKKAKRKKTIKRLLAGATVIALLGTGTYFIVENRNVIGGKLKALFNHDKKIETTVTDKKNSNNTYTSLSSTSYKSVENDENNDSDYDENLKKANSDEKKDIEILTAVTTNTVVNYSDEEIMDALSDNLRRINASYFEVSQYINGHGLSGTAYFYDFENLFQPGTTDYNSVYVFSRMRNEIIKSVYSKEDPDSIKKMITNYYKKFIEFFVLNNTCTYTLDNQKYVLNYNELSDMAKLVILELGDAMLTVSCDYKYDDGKDVFDKFEVIEQNAAMRNELVRKISNKGYKK